MSISTSRRLLFCLAGLLVCGCGRESTSSLGTQLAHEEEKPQLHASLVDQGYVAVPLKRLNSGYLGVEVRVAAKPLLLLVDTGASATHFDPTRTKSLGLKWSALEDYGWFTRSHRFCVIDSMEIGPVITGQLRIMADDIGTLNPFLRSYDDPPMDGLLGSDVLVPHSAVIDYPNHTLYLKTTASRESGKAVVSEPVEERDDRRFRVVRLALAKDGKLIRMFVKLDLCSGQTWLLEGTTDARWTPVGEEDERAKPAGGPSRRYEFAVHEFFKNGSSQSIALRFDRETGHTWWLEGSIALEWKLVPDENRSDDSPSGTSQRFEWACHSFTAGGKKLEVYLKLDRQTGRTWKLDGAAEARWQPLPEQDSAEKPSAGPGMRYRFYSFDLTSGEVYARFELSTGRAWRWSGTEPAWTFIKESLKQEK